jgi:uncharacterized surface anchored protein
MKNFGLAMLLVLALASMAAADAELVSITGTVVSATDQVMVLKTATGDMTFDIDKDTERPGSLPVNSRVTVWYDSDDDPADKVDARRIVMAPAAPTPAPAPVTPAPSTPSYQPQSTTTTTTTTRTTDTDYEREELPQTAGPLPLLLGAGLLAIGGGAALLKKR